MNIISRWFHRLRYYPWGRSIRFFFQRLTRGWDDGQTFSLDYSLAKLIYPRLHRFQQVRAGRPFEMTDQEWESIIQQMVAAFAYLSSEKRWDCGDPDYQKNEEMASRGVKLFGEHYGHLWW